MNLVRVRVIPGRHAEHSGRFQMRSVAHNENVGTVTQTPRKTHFRTAPIVRLAGDTEMKENLCVDPSVLRIIKISRAAPVACQVANPPLVSAELQFSGLREMRSARALYGC